MNHFKILFIYAVIGIIPLALGNYSIIDWQWWSSSIFLIGSLWFHDSGIRELHET